MAVGACCAGVWQGVAVHSIPSTGPPVCVFCGWCPALFQAAVLMPPCTYTGWGSACVPHLWQLVVFGAMSWWGWMKPHSSAVNAYLSALLTYFTYNASGLCIPV